MTSRPFSSMITVFYLYLIILLITLVDHLPFYTQGKVVNITLTLSQNDVSPDGVVRLAKVTLSTAMR